MAIERDMTEEELLDVVKATTIISTDCAKKLKKLKEKLDKQKEGRMGKEERAAKPRKEEER